MKSRTLLYLLSTLIAAAFVLAACGGEEESTTEPSATNTPKPAAAQESTESQPVQKPKSYSAPPPMTIDPDKSYTATVQLEKGGEFVIELFAKEAPKTVNNFVFLSREGYYDGVTFHRVIAGFMAQGGDPTGTGAGGPGYRFEDEFHPDRRHDSAGVLSMANAGPGTNGSQFFITFVATPFLDDKHTVFGKVIEGMDVVNGISLRDPGAATAPGDAIATIAIEEGQ